MKISLKSLLSAITAAAIILMPALPLFAGNLDQTLAPDDPATAMFTLEDIYNRLLNGTTATKRVGPFAEPGAGPAATGHTLDDIYNLIGTRAFVPETGQTARYDTNATKADDGGTDPPGSALPTPRFTVNADTTVTDKLTGLIWGPDANLIATRSNSTDDTDSTANDGKVRWQTALNFIVTLNLGSYLGHNDWRLPILRELQSLIHYGYFDPAVPNTAGTAKWTAGNPFNNVVSSCYWTSTTYSNFMHTAWSVNLGFGSVDESGKTVTYYYVWPVRGGQ